MRDVGGARRLALRGVQQDGVRAVEVRVDHDGRAASKVHELLPPVGHIVLDPSRLEGGPGGGIQ